MIKSGWVRLREKRDALLKDSDWTQMPDSPLSDSKKAQWATYRQELRELPQKWPSDVDTTTIDPYVNDDGVEWSWPTKPT